MFTRCPKCDHAPLPQDQSLPAACPACGAVLAKVREVMEAAAQGRLARRARTRRQAPASLWLKVPTRVSTTAFRSRVALWAVFALWGLWLIGCDHRSGEIGQSFLHGPLLVFHEAGHVIFRLLGPWVSVLGGTLGQLLMPAIMSAALLRQRHDPFGAALGLWFVGVSLLDVAPYVYDALHPQLTLLGGGTGEEGGHDWIYLLGSMGLLRQAQGLGTLVRWLGAAVVLGALGWAAAVLKRQHARLDPAARSDE
jgi:hypothetical protein